MDGQLRKVGTICGFEIESESLEPWRPDPGFLRFYVLNHKHLVYQRISLSYAFFHGFMPHHSNINKKIK